MALLARFLLWVFGWKWVMKVNVPPKCVICVAPHTSNWDFFLGKIFYASVGGKPHFLMKQEWFFFPLSYILKAIGGIPVKRGKRTSLTEQMIEEFNHRTHFQLAIAPEGTRKKNAHWKSGFYYIAYGANVPISLAHIDYSMKEIGISENFHPSGDEKNDITKIKLFYKNFSGKHPERFTV